MRPAAQLAAELAAELVAELATQLAAQLAAHLWHIQVLSISSVVYGLLYLFLEPNPNDPLNHEAAQVGRCSFSSRIGCYAHSFFRTGESTE